MLYWCIAGGIGPRADQLDQIRRSGGDSRVRGRTVPPRRASWTARAARLPISSVALGAVLGKSRSSQWPLTSVEAWLRHHGVDARSPRVATTSRARISLQPVGSHPRRLTPSRAPHIAHVINPTPLPAQDCFSELASAALGGMVPPNGSSLSLGSISPAETDGAMWCLLHSCHVSDLNDCPPRAVCRLVHRTSSISICNSD
jgi:hypothetical protein